MAAVMQSFACNVLFADCKLGAEGGSRAKSILERNTALTDLYVGSRSGDGSPNGERGFM